MNIFSSPWPWYIAGPLIGLLVPILLLIDNKQFGISSTLRDFCAYVLPSKNDYFKYNLKDQIWRNLLVFGVLLGGILSYLIWGNTNTATISQQTITDLSALGFSPVNGLVPVEIFSWSNLISVNGFLFIVLGGFFIGFGTRYADGCTAGHAIFGLSILSPASLVSVIGFFVGGLFSTHILLPLIF